MARIKMHISKAKLPFYPPCEVKCRLQNGVSTQKLGILGNGIMHARKGLCMHEFSLRAQAISCVCKSLPKNPN